MTVRDEIFNYMINSKIPKDGNVYYCESRDQTSGRFSKWLNYFLSCGLNDKTSAILVAILGELTNNSFDHNLGKWNNLPGCIVGFEKSESSILIYVADRGQGIISSLKNAFDSCLPSALIIQKAFEEKISGRAPERRGNGLKFVLKHVKDFKSSLSCFSQGETYQVGRFQVPLNIENLPKQFGTLIAIQWSLK